MWAQLWLPLVALSYLCNLCLETLANFFFKEKKNKGHFCKLMFILFLVWLEKYYNNALSGDDLMLLF